MTLTANLLGEIKLLKIIKKKKVWQARFDPFASTNQTAIVVQPRTAVLGAGFSRLPSKLQTDLIAEGRRATQPPQETRFSRVALGLQRLPLEESSCWPLNLDTFKHFFFFFSEAIRPHQSTIQAGKSDFYIQHISWLQSCQKARFCV